MDLGEFCTQIHSRVQIKSDSQIMSDSQTMSDSQVKACAPTAGSAMAPIAAV